MAPFSELVPILHTNSAKGRHAMVPSKRIQWPDVGNGRNLLMVMNGKDDHEFPTLVEAQGLR